MWIKAVCAVVALGSVVLRPDASAAGEPVGRVVGARGTVEVARGGEEDWRALLVGSTVFTGDRIRAPGGAVAKILFDDDSVVDIGGEALLEIARYDVDPAATSPRSLLQLQSGSLLARVSDFYAEELWRYEIETPNVVARARPGTILVEHDLNAAASDVATLEHGAQVRSVLGVIGPAVDLEAGQFTRTQQGKFPSPPQALSADARAAYEDDLFLLGTGQREGLEVNHPLVAGAMLRDDDRPPETAARGAAAARYDLEPEPPGETLQDRLSPDLRVHTQPIPEFESVPPGEAPSGGVEVDF